MSKHGSHCCAKFVGFREDIGIKEHFADDAHRQLCHLLTDINHLPFSPALLNLLAVFDHSVSIAGDLPWLKCGSYQFALPPVERPLAGEDAITNHRAECIMRCLSFIKIIGVLNKDAMHVL